MTTNITAPQNQVVYQPAVNNISQQQPIQPADIQVPPPAQTEESSNLLWNTITGLALLSTATYLGVNLLKGRGKNPIKTLEAFKQQGGTFEKGVAKLKDGSLYTGIIEHTNKTGDVYYRSYNAGKLESAAKNIDSFYYPDPSKTSHFLKTYGHSPEGKISSIKRTTVQDGNKIEQTLQKTNLKTLENFEASGGKFVEGKPINADGSDFKGFIVERDGANTIIKEYADGKQVSERLNTTLKDRAINGRTNTYNLDEQGLIEREQARIAQEKEMQKWSYKVKNWFKNLFATKPKSETAPVTPETPPVATP